MMESCAEESKPKPAVRYSQGKKEMGAAKDFSWEHPVPDNLFWSDLPFTIARNFLQAFSPSELEHLPIDPDSTADRATKIQLLLDILLDEAKREDQSASTILGESQTFYSANYEGWSTLWLAVYTMQHALGHMDAAEKTIRMLDEQRPDKGNLSHRHTLAGVLLETGRFGAAEEMAKLVREWLDGRLGRNSPQAMGSRRLIAEAVWRQGRRGEARGLVEEIRGLIAGMGDTRFGIYEDSEREMLEELVRKLGMEGGQGSS